MRVETETILLTSSCGVRGSCPLLPLPSQSLLLVTARDDSKGGGAGGGLHSELVFGWRIAGLI